MRLMVIGIDLAGSIKRITGLCFMDSSLTVKLSRARFDEDILSFISRHDADLVAIDAPLSLPRGSRSMRNCDIELRKAGVRLFPPLLGPMRILTKRAIRLRKILEKKGYEVIEVFPTGARSFLGLPPKKAGIHALRGALVSLGVKGIPDDADQHLLDAVICSLVGHHYLRGEYIEFGDRREGVIIMPQPRGQII